MLARWQTKVNVPVVSRSSGEAWRAPSVMAMPLTSTRTSFTCE